MQPPVNICRKMERANRAIQLKLSLTSCIKISVELIVMGVTEREEALQRLLLCVFLIYEQPDGGNGNI